MFQFWSLAINEVNWVVMQQEWCHHATNIHSPWGTSLESYPLNEALESYPLSHIPWMKPLRHIPWVISLEWSPWGTSLESYTNGREPSVLVQYNVLTHRVCQNHEFIPLQSCVNKTQDKINEQRKQEWPVLECRVLEYNSDCFIHTHTWLIPNIWHKYNSYIPQMEQHEPEERMLFVWGL